MENYIISCVAIVFSLLLYWFVNHACKEREKLIKQIRHLEERLEDHAEEHGKDLERLKELKKQLEEK